MMVAELQNGFLDLAQKIYCAEETAGRRRKFKRMLKTSPNFGHRVERREELLAA